MTEPSVSSQASPSGGRVSRDASRAGRRERLLRRDTSHPAMEEHMRAVATLQELGVADRHGAGAEQGRSDRYDPAAARARADGVAISAAAAPAWTRSWPRRARPAAGRNVTLRIARTAPRGLLRARRCSRAATAPATVEARRRSAIGCSGAARYACRAPSVSDGRRAHPWTRQLVDDIRILLIPCS